MGSKTFCLFCVKYFKSSSSFKDIRVGSNRCKQLSSGRVPAAHWQPGCLRRLFPLGVPALGSGLPGGMYTKRGEEKPILQGEEESPSPVPGEQSLSFVSHSEGGVTKELATRKVCRSLSPVVEEETLSLLLKKSR